MEETVMKRITMGCGIPEKGMIKDNKTAYNFEIFKE
jgi:hypothetical protein